MQGLMQALASQAAVALERARLYRRLEQRVEAADAELRATNLSLGNEKAKLTAMIEHMADAVIMIDADGRLLIVNDAAAAMFELGDEPLTGRPAIEVENLALATVLAVGETGAEGKELTLDHPLPRTVRVHSATVESNEGRVGKVVVCTDITELKELAQLRSELVSFVSHELRTPLTSIKGFAAALLDDARLKHDDHRNFVRIIDHECDRLRRMVADLLCMSRIDSGRALEVQWRRFDLNELVQRVVAAQRVYAAEHSFLSELPEGAFVVEADSDKIEQILTNLLNNAIKYSPRDAATTVRVEPRGEQVALIVADKGFGIAPHDIDRLFTQYGRLEDAQRRRITGTGLGLYLTKHLVEAHGGTIEVESELGQGSTFTVTMPRRRPWVGE
jgi:two-component system phosphate regulon sensor histidine kinase PhoR